MDNHEKDHVTQVQSGVRMRSTMLLKCDLKYTKEVYNLKEVYDMLKYTI